MLAGAGARRRGATPARGLAGRLDLAEIGARPDAELNPGNPWRRRMGNLCCPACASHHSPRLKTSKGVHSWFVHFFACL
jgi:hypothetical protein